jgi:hypothetical protein
MKLTVAISAERDQIFVCVIAKRTPRTNVVHLEAFRGSAVLASPSIPLEDIAVKLAVGILLEPYPRLSL